jgi:hypothetical protein
MCCHERCERVYLSCYSLERIHAYINIEQEPKPTKEGIPPAYWPASGDLRVENLSSRYSLVCESSLLSPFRFSYRAIRMDRKFFTTYPSISSLANVSVSVSTNKTY